MTVKNINFKDILLDEKLYTNILIYVMSHKTSTGANPLRIRYDKIDGFIKIYGGIRYLVLLKYKEIYDRVRYLISEKCDITNSINHNFARISINSYNSLPIHNFTMLIKSVVDKNEHNYYYNIFFKKGSYKDESNT